MIKNRILLNCCNCNKEIERNAYRVNRNKNHFCCIQCFSNFRFGKPIKERVESDYRRSSGNHSRLQHRAIVEAHLGRKLLRSEYVHHRNQDKQDNRIENLEILTAQQHNDIHLSKYPKTKICVVCGGEFMPKRTKRKRNKVCGEECRRKYLSQITKARYAKKQKQAA